MAVVAVFVIGRGRTEILVEQGVGRWSYSTVSSLTTLRSELAIAALELAKDQPMGYGVHNSGPLLARLVNTGHTSSDAHNEFLNTLLDGGILAFLLFVVGHGALLRSVFGVARDLALTWPLVVLVSVHLSFLGSSTGSDKITCIVLGLILGAVEWNEAGVAPEASHGVAHDAGP
jgi:O-antigen ligase